MGSMSGDFKTLEINLPKIRYRKSEDKSEDKSEWLDKLINKIENMRNKISKNS